MSTKHNTKHNRRRSHYPDRLRARGKTSASVRMTDVEVLRRKQERAREAAGETA